MFLIAIFKHYNYLYIKIIIKVSSILAIKLFACRIVMYDIFQLVGKFFFLKYKNYGKNLESYKTWHNAVFYVRDTQKRWYIKVAIKILLLLVQKFPICVYGTYCVYMFINIYDYHKKYNVTTALRTLIRAFK